ncbi:hypothetical protein jhhlp_008461 [Lomentospora prolificans]|uniref:AMP-dependent synthetase/ligase domain-containing protein n=1 Tax=Lomentospora prolificans TaxID=41688 RepID=A0A2N3MY42_9PEZI|nr:hypothetical protein jhhlp_008461 [Lomentospora prolificans]
MATTIYRSDVSPLTEFDSLSIPQWITQYNPDLVLADKVVHSDDFSNDVITYGSLRHDASRLAWGLRNKLGVKEGDIVLALVPNSNDFVLLAHVIWWAGAVFAPLNTAATQSDIEHVLGLVKPTHVAVSTAVSRLNLVHAAVRSVNITRPKVFTLHGKVDSLPRFPVDVMGGSDSESLPPYDLGGKAGKDVLSTICFSSGTTGKMKGVKLSHFNLIANVLQIRVALPTRLTSKVREVWFPPYCHIYGLFAVVLTGMWLGGHYHGLREFNLERYCEKSSELRATDMHIVPPVALLLAASPVTQKFDLSSVKRIVVAAAPLKPELQRKLKQRFPDANVCQGYGLSECSPSVSHQFEQDEDQIGTVGKILPGTELRLVHPETLKDVPEGEEGELWVRGPQVMMGYINDEAATKQTFHGDWLRTGDIGKLQNGNLWITDRFKEMIKYKGLQVAPSELEDLLLQHPAVADAAVCSVYDDAEVTEVPLAYVSLGPKHVDLPSKEKEALLGEIRNWADARVAGYKKLRGGVFHLQVLPKNPTGKILRRLLPVKLKETRSQKL